MRIARVTSPGVVHHVISRFVDRGWFFHDAEERGRYLNLLERAMGVSDWRVLAFALMSNHIHLAMIAGESRAEHWLKRVHSPFANWMNKRHGRIGPLFAGRPDAWAVRPEHVADVIAYIHNNPVRAGIVERASDSAWTSHRMYARESAAPTWICAGDGLARSGFLERPDEFDAFVRATAGRATLELAPLEKVARAAHRRGAIEVATPSVGRPVDVPLVARPFATIRAEPRTVVAAAVEELKIGEAEICSRTRRPGFPEIRRAVLRAGTLLGLSVSDMAAALGVTRQAGSKMARPEVSAADQELARRICGRVTAMRVRAS